MTGQRAEVFALRVQPGREEEYLARHSAIWPELEQLFFANGIRRYEIHLHRETGLLFAFRLVDIDADLGAIMDHPVMQRWRVHMADVLVQDDGRPVRELLERMYVFNPPG
ncbi:L-rhamnose mutarotase [uncultured Alsobacter sp.]|uniref:L-rhamnose mutarotase n=1 Tax=uncultured Alsobacter sp. TaxID=1748258 RepID=UPI0025D2EB8E|nr:L-rhamnose mutarotase [uncultured Alsobacter sp.]